MSITVETPDALVGVLAQEDKDPARGVLEAVALEGYRKRLLGESAVRCLLGFETRMDVHRVFKDNGVYLHYKMADLEHDLAEAGRYGGLPEANRPPGELR